MITPAQLKGEIADLRQGAGIRARGLHYLADIIHRRDHRLLVICGPAPFTTWRSPKSTQPDLKALHDAYQDSLHCDAGLLRETPHHSGLERLYQRSQSDGTFDVELGSHRARELLCSLAEMELPR